MNFGFAVLQQLKKQVTGRYFITFNGRRASKPNFLETFHEMN
jgi:hypothetical protein